MRKSILKILTSTLIAYTALTSISALASPKSDPFTGPYLGLQTGLGYSGPKVQYENPNTASRFGEKSSSGHGAIVGIFAGYGQTFNHLYLGSEVYVDARKIKSKFTQTISAFANSFTIENEIENRHAFGILLKPGVKFDSTLLYTNLGFELSKFQAKQSSSINMGGFVTTIDYKKSKNLNGYVFGAGIEHVLSSTPNIKLRADYKYIAYEDFNFRQTQTILKCLDENIITIGASYSF